MHSLSSAASTAPRPWRTVVRAATFFSFATLLACTESDQAGGTPAPRPAETVAPACTVAPGSKEVFTTAIIPAEVVYGSLPLGDMSPETFEEAFPNRETGFAIFGTESEVPVLAPTKLYLETFESTFFHDDFGDSFKRGQLDFSMGFWVCDQIWGELHHVTGLGEPFVAALAARLGTTFDDLVSRQVNVEGSDVTCSLAVINQDANGAIKHACIESWLGAAGDAAPENVTCVSEGTLSRCGIRFTQDGGSFLEIEEGAVLGTTAGFEGSTFHPGLDFNMVDLRHAWEFVNPARLGDPSEMRTRSYRNAACPYEYFADGGYRDALLAKVGNYFGIRNAPDAPCGTLDVDVPNTAAGTWIFAGAGELDADVALQDINLLEHHHIFHNNVLTLAPDVIEPADWMVISTPLTSVVEDPDGSPQLVRIPKGGAGNVGTPFDEMLPDELYCVAGAYEYGGVDQPVAYLLTFSVGATPADSELWLQPYGTSCPEGGAWAFDEGSALRFVR